MFLRQAVAACIIALLQDCLEFSCYDDDDDDVYYWWCNVRSCQKVSRVDCTMRWSATPHNRTRNSPSTEYSPLYVLLSLSLSLSLCHCLCVCQCVSVSLLLLASTSNDTGAVGVCGVVRWWHTWEGPTCLIIELSAIRLYTHSRTLRSLMIAMKTTAEKPSSTAVVLKKKCGRVGLKPNRSGLIGT